MSTIDRIRSILRPPAPDERMLTPAQVWGRGGIWKPYTSAGIAVTAEMAMQAAVGACVRLLADDISSLPVDVYRKVNGEAIATDKPTWLEYPTGRRWDTFQAFSSDVVVSLLTDGGAFIECVPDTYRPEFFSVKDPTQWRIELRGGAAIYIGPDGVELMDDRMAYIPWVRMPGSLRGLSVLAASAESTGLELAARQWAGAFFANGGTLGTVIKHPGKPSTDELELMRQSFEKRHTGAENAFRLGILTMGADLKDGTIKPQEAALEPLWKHVLEEAARIYHIPPHLLGSQDTGSASFASVEQRSIEYITHAVVPITTRLESAFGRFLSGDRYVKLNVNALLRGDMKARADWYQMALQNKVMRPSEVRAKEDLPPDAEMTGYLETPNNNGPDAAEPPSDTDSESASITIAPSLRIDSVEVSEAGVDRIAAASTDGIATGVAVLGDNLRHTFADAIEPVSRQLDEVKAEQARIVARQEAAEERERIRSLPVSIRIKGDHVYEQRGDDVTVKRVTRDETGKVIGLIAESA